jgi:ABC-type transport system involved in multi-copper enzyme maturation permease subunit
MIRFAWVQSRAQTAVAIAGLLVIAIGAAVSGPHLVHLYNATVASCRSRGDCSAATSAFLRNDSTLDTWLGVLVVVVPGIIGIFWGAPLIARELETGTFRLAWTQSVTRNRWLTVKLAVVGAASMAVTGLLSLAVTWWASPLDRANMDAFHTFDQRDIVPIGYAALAFALGVAAGVLIRRSLPAMATTLAAFVGARLAIAHLIRPQLIAPLHQDIAINGSSIVGYGSTSGPGSAGTLQLAPSNIPNAWIYSARLVDKAGHGMTSQFLQSNCPNVVRDPGGGGPGGIGLGGGGSHSQVPVGAQQALQDCAAKAAAKFHEVLTYQPANRYWTFQWHELAITLAVSLIFVGVSFWAVRRRLV